MLTTCEQTYSNPDFFKKSCVGPGGHIKSVTTRIGHGDYILFDSSDIQKRYAKMMEGLDYLKDGDKGSLGLGYWLMDVVHFSKEHEMTPLLNKLYSFDHGAKSENKEIMEAINEVDSRIEKDVTKIFDRGMDRPICRDFIIAGEGYFILRLKKTTKMIYNGNEIPVNKISRRSPCLWNLLQQKRAKTKSTKLPLSVVR